MFTSFFIICSFFYSFSTYLLLTLLSLHSSLVYFKIYLYKLETHHSYIFEKHKHEPSNQIAHFPHFEKSRNNTISDRIIRHFS